MRDGSLAFGALVVACAGLWGFCAVTREFADVGRATLQGAAYGIALAAGYGAGCGAFLAVLWLFEEH